MTFFLFSYFCDVTQQTFYSIVDVTKIKRTVTTNNFWRVTLLTVVEDVDKVIKSWMVFRVKAGQSTNKGPCIFFQFFKRNFLRALKNLKEKYHLFPFPSSSHREFIFESINCITRKVFHEKQTCLHNYHQVLILNYIK